MPPSNIQSPNLIQAPSLHDCLEPMPDLQHNNLQNELMNYGDHSSIMQMQGGPLVSNSSIVNM